MSASSSATASDADRSSRKIEDREIVEQVRQAEASHQVAEADDPPARGRPQSRPDQRRALAQPVRPPAAAQADPRRRRSALHLGASRSSIFASAARAVRRAAAGAPHQPRNTNVVSPVDGFVAKRNVDPGAWVSQQRAGRVGRRYLVAAPGRQRRREGPARWSTSATRRGRSRRLSRREVQRPHRARVARSSIRRRARRRWKSRSPIRTSV